MKRIALLAVIGAGLLALPGTASAQTSNCSGAVGTTPSGDPCVNVAGAGGEVVLRPGGCSYINAWTTNPGTPGYAGICQNASHDPGCDGVDGDSGMNNGGCFWIKPLPDEVNQAIQNPVTDTFICGNTSGEDPKNSTRAGCSIP